MPARLSAAEMRDRTSEALSQKAWYGTRKECDPQYLAGHFCLRPLRVFPPNPCLGQIASQVTHFQRQEQALFARHGPINLDLNGLCFRACVAERHTQNLIR